MEPQSATDSSESDPAVTISRLQAELEESGRTEDRSAVSRVTDEVETTLFEPGTFSFEERHVKSSLDELLLSLVGLRSTDTHGKQLLDDLASEFDTVLSPGTVYPRLHDLCEEDVLERRELVKTKEYTFADADAARATVASAARQHLALGMIFRAALEQEELSESELKSESRPAFDASPGR